MSLWQPCLLLGLSFILSTTFWGLLFAFGLSSYEIIHRILFGRWSEKDSPAEAYLKEKWRELIASQQITGHVHADIHAQSEEVPSKHDSTNAVPHDASLPPPLVIGCPPELSWLFEVWFGWSSFLYIGLTLSFLFKILWQQHDDVLALAKASTMAFMVTACFDLGMNWAYLLVWVYNNKFCAAEGKEPSEGLNGEMVDCDGRSEKSL